MTIESVSFPADLGQWDGSGAEPYYFEVFGETMPLVDTAYAEVVPVGSSIDPGIQTTWPAPVYEYWWTIGHVGHRAEHSGFIEHVTGPSDPWARLPDPAARVYLYFPTGGNWRVKELAATVKYMSPIAHEESFGEKVAQGWQTIGPLVEAASTLAGAVQPIAGTAATQSAKILGAIAQLKLTSVPAIEGFEWSAGKVALGDKQYGGVGQGVMWTLPPSMFRELGGRLTGSLGVSFIPDHKQNPGMAARQPEAPEAQDLLAHAVVYSPEGHDYDHWAPGIHDFVRLRVAPRLPQPTT
jgi:hypothetical protein